MMQRRLEIRGTAWVLLVVMLVSSACQAVGPGAEPAEAEWPAPRLVARSPAPGMEQPLDAAVTLTFDQAMDAESVAAALTISPTVRGALHWTDDRTAVFAPEAALARGAEYRVALTTTARSATGKALAEPVAFDFDTIGFLAVSEAYPAPDSRDVDPGSPVRVVFNRPVVPLNPLEQSGELPEPLVFSPTVAGRGEWVNTSIYVFTPTGGLLPATAYTVRVSSGLTDTTGGMLPEAYRWQFTTIAPAVRQSDPPDGFALWGPGDAVRVTFNQPMDHASVEARFALIVAGQPVTGSFQWTGGESSVVSETLAFTPRPGLPRAAEVTLQVAAGALTRNGAALASDYRARFTTIRAPGLVSSVPRDGAARVDPGIVRARLHFASPMDTRVFTQYLHVAPVPDGIRVSWNLTKTVAEVSFYAGPKTTYRLALDAVLPDQYGDPLGKPVAIRFTTEDFKPEASLNRSARIGMYDAYTVTRVYASVLNVSRLDLKLYRVPLESFLQVNQSNQYDAWDQYQPQDAELLREWSQPVAVPLNLTALVRVDLDQDRGVLLPSGIYYLSMTAPELADRDADPPPGLVFIRSHFNLVLKQSEDSVAVWATDLATGTPVNGLPLRFAEGGLLLAGNGEVTGEDGLYEGPGPVGADRLQTYSMVWSGDPGKANFAVTLQEWSSGIEYYNFNVSGKRIGFAGDYRAALYTDRPVYRPGQTIYFKGIVRADDDTRYRVPEGPHLIAVKLMDRTGKPIYDETLTLNEMGSLSGAIPLDGEAPLGGYWLSLHSVSGEQLAGIYLQVSEYRKADFQVTVTSERPVYFAGETLTVTAAADYYFGGPVAGATVTWRLFTAGYSFKYPCPGGRSCPWYDWRDDPEAGPWRFFDDGVMSWQAEGDGQTDAQGRVTFQVPADLGTARSSREFLIEVTVRDASGQSVSRRTGVVVHAGEFYLGAAPRGILAEVGKEQAVELLAVSAPPVAEGVPEPVAELPLTVVFMEHHWNSAQRQAENGRYYWESSVEDIPVVTTTVRTDEEGRAVAAFIPARGGAYRVRVSGRDARGHPVYGGTYLWVRDERNFVPWRRESNNRIALIADRREYQVGEVARILVPSPFSGTVRALVTVERAGIMDSEVRELSGNSPVLEIPIRAEYQPNVFVSVILIQGARQSAEGLPGFKMGLIELPVRVEGKTLQVTLTPDRMSTYRPREVVTYTVQVSDAAGRPVETELSLRLADLAALALADEPDPALEEVFWNRRPLGVHTAMALTVAMEPLNRELAPGAKGGGGAVHPELPVRDRFTDTAFWDAAVRTDKNGRAQVVVTLPDNLTTWRMQARTVTGDARVGQATADVVSTLDLLVQPVLPRFLVTGDRVQLATIVHNRTAVSRNVTVTLRSEGLILAGSDRQVVRVAGGDQAKVVWPVSVSDGTAVTVAMAARAGDGDGPVLADAREDRLPVYRYSTPEVVATAGQLDGPGARMEVVNLPRNFDSTQGALDVRVEGSLIAAVQGSLTYLEGYPYECTEQTVSRFLPQLTMMEALRAEALATPEAEADLAMQIRLGLQRLYSTQHSDGGWGWWTADTSNPYLTAYALQGLIQAHRAGFPVDPLALKRAVDYLYEEFQLPEPGTESERFDALAYQLYVQVETVRDFPEHSWGELGSAVRLFEQRGHLGYEGKAFLARALALLEPQEPARVATLLNELAGAAHIGATGVHWEEAVSDLGSMNTDVRSTAVVLWALSALQPESDLLPGGVRWLMAARRDGIWGSTQETAWAVTALAAFARTNGMSAGDFDYTVALNRRLILEGAAGPGSEESVRRTAVAVSDLLTGTANSLRIERPAGGDGKGTGSLYYEVALRTYQPAEAMTALNRGIIVSRQYSRVESPQTPITVATVGEELAVQLTLIVPQGLHYVLVEDFLPAGCEGVDPHLATSGRAGIPMEALDRASEDFLSAYHWNWASHVDLRDEKLVLFAEYLPAGTYEYTYRIRAIVPGEFRVLPAVASEMYFPEVFGRSAGTLFTVGP